MTPTYIVALIGAIGASIVGAHDDIDEANKDARQRAAQYPGRRYVVYTLKHVHWAPAPAQASD